MTSVQGQCRANVNSIDRGASLAARKVSFMRSPTLKHNWKFMSSKLGSQFSMMCGDSQLGQQIWEAVRRTWASALRYAQRSVRDPSVAAECLEDAAAAVLRANREKLDGVRNLDAYLLRAFA